MSASAAATVTVSAILSAYTEERWSQLVNAMISVQRQTRPPDQIIVVIDHNPAMLARLRADFPTVEAAANPFAQGCAGARNAGLLRATGDLIAFFDDDMIAAPDWLERALPAFADPNTLGLFGAPIATWEQAAPRWFPAEFNWVIGCAYPGMPTSRAPMRNLWGSNMLIRRSVFARVGGLETSLGRVGKYPSGAEETELCLRAARAWPNGVFLYEPQARIQHFVAPSRGRWSYFAARCSVEGGVKARLARVYGARQALASERAYTCRTLPLGALNGLRDALRGDGWGLARSGAILAGLALTAWGYLRGRLERAPRASISGGRVSDGGRMNGGRMNSRLLGDSATRGAFVGPS